MENLVNISIYTSYFHDGAIINIHQTKDEIQIGMESAELLDQEISSKIHLSVDKRIKGILHLKRPIQIQINENKSCINLQMLADSGEILDLNITENKVHLFIEWSNYPPTNNRLFYTDFVIDADIVFWENKPDWQLGL